MKPIATAAAVLAGRQDEPESKREDVLPAEPNWQLLGDVVRKILTKTTADYLTRKDA